MEKGNYSYYQETKMNEDKHLFVFGRENNKNLNHLELTLGQGIQGIFAQDEVLFYLSNNEQYDYWLNYLEDEYSITNESITLEEMILKYLDKYDDVGYILYDYTNNNESLNVATSLSGVLGYLPVDKSLEEKVSLLGLEMKLDVREMSERDLFDQYKDSLNNKGLVQLKPSISHFRDYGITNKFIYFYQEKSTSQALNLRKDIHEWALKDSPIYGWGPGTEDSHVGIASRAGQFTIPSDYSYNTTVFSADIFKFDSIKTPNLNEEVEINPDKHYVTFIRSDGDNIQTWYNYFPFNQKDMAAIRGDFKFGWSIQPSLLDLAPSILKHTYDKADINDYFVVAVSGHGYMYPSLYPNLDSYISSLNYYMEKTDLSVVQILDSGPYDEIIEAYSKAPNLKGGMYMYGDKYAGGKGEIFWSKNGKPFVSFRESVWDVNILDVAGRVNNYEKNPYDISGYTLINLHPWSHSYDDIKELVSHFDSHIEIVSPDEFIDLIIKNVPKENKAP
ncbi:MAG: GxGYxYP domain-containing protein [Acholeplasmataceae bacterium]